MEIVKTANEWAKAEIFSSAFFIIFGIVFVLASWGFRQIGKTELAKAFVTPTLVAGILLCIIGIGLVYSNIVRLNSFETAYHNDAAAFVSAEIQRTAKTIASYQSIVFKIIPLIIVVVAVLMMWLDKPIWRASLITTIAMLIVLVFIDSNATARMQGYHQQLQSADKTEP